MVHQFITQFLKFLALVTIGFISLVFITTQASNRLYLGDGEINSSFHGISLLNKEDNFFLIAYPLNDYYYTGNKKERLLSEVEKSEEETALSEIWISFNDLFLNRQHVARTFSGTNKEGKAKITYLIFSSNHKLEVERKIDLETAVAAVGQTIKICSSCFVADDKKRAYFSNDFATENLLEVARKAGYTPFLLRQDQLLPKNISEIAILDKNADKKMGIQIFPYNEIFLKDGEIELKTYIKEAKKVNIKQVLSTL